MKIKSNTILFIALLVGSSIPIGIDRIYAQTENQTNTNDFNLLSQTPFTIYFTQSGGWFGQFIHKMFDSHSLQVMEIPSTASGPIFKSVSDQEYLSLIEYIFDTTNMEFFKLPSPPIAECFDCIRTFLTITAPTIQGTISNTVFYNDISEADPIVREIANRIIDMPSDDMSGTNDTSQLTTFIPPLHNGTTTQ